MAENQTQVLEKAFIAKLIERMYRQYLSKENAWWAVIPGDDDEEFMDIIAKMPIDVLSKYVLYSDDGEAIYWVYTLPEVIDAIDDDYEKSKYTPHELIGMFIKLDGSVYDYIAKDAIYENAKKTLTLQVCREKASVIIYNVLFNDRKIAEIKVDESKNEIELTNNCRW